MLASAPQLAPCISCKICSSWFAPEFGDVSQARRQANAEQGNPPEQHSQQVIPVKSAAEAFVENNLSANLAQGKPKKAAPVAVR